MTPVALVCDDPARYRGLLETLRAQPSYEFVEQMRNRADCLAALTTTRARILLVASSLPDSSGLDLVAVIQQRRPDLGVVMVLEGSEGPDIWQRIVAMGIRGVLLPPYSQPALIQAFALCRAGMTEAGAVTAASAASKERAYVCTFTSARGGMGTTLVAVNVAALLAQWSKGVLLMDYTGQPGDFAMFLDDVPRRTIQDLLFASGEIDADLLEAVLARHPSGIRYLSSPPQAADPNLLSRQLASDVIRHARGLAEFILIDAGNLNVPATESALLESDLIVVVTMRDVVRLASTRRYLLQMAAARIEPERIKVVVNQSEVGVEISNAEVESILKHPVTEALPVDMAVAVKSVNSGKPFAAANPKLPLSQGLNRIAQLVHTHDRRRTGSGDREGTSKSRGGGVAAKLADMMFQRRVETPGAAG